jgi:hypothetical protein
MAHPVEGTKIDRRRSEPSFDVLFPKLDKIELHPRFTTGVWLVTLKGEDHGHAVAWTTLRDWLKKYAR